MSPTKWNKKSDNVDFLKDRMGLGVFQGFGGLDSRVMRIPDKSQGLQWQWEIELVIANGATTQAEEQSF